MKWFNNWFRKKCVQALNHYGMRFHDPNDDQKHDRLRDKWENLKIESNSVMPIIHHRHSTNSVKDLNFVNHFTTESDFSLKIYHAASGYVVEYIKSHRTLMKENSESPTSLYIISDDKELGHELTKIITLEKLKR